MDYLIAGLGTGLIHAIVYNPYDRALYLSVKDSRKFLDKNNWTKPFQGLGQSLTHRTLSSGLYFSIQSIISKHTNNPLTIGLVGGVTNAILLNQISVVKYNCWGKNNINFAQSISELYKNGGVRVFGKGMFSTVVRDVVFCCVYETMRNKKSVTPVLSNSDLKPKKTGLNIIKDEVYNLGVGVTATILSSPFNYVRTIKYATPSNVKCKSDIRILFDLVKNRNFKDLRIGWGTFRCGMGMVTGQFFFFFFIIVYLRFYIIFFFNFFLFFYFGRAHV